MRKIAAAGGLASVVVAYPSDIQHGFECWKDSAVMAYVVHSSDALIALITLRPKRRAQLNERWRNVSRRSATIFFDKGQRQRKRCHQFSQST